MNRYGRMAMEHWREAAPNRFAAIPDPEAFFSTLGLEVESRVQALQSQLAGPDPVGEEYLAKVGRLNAARSQAEEAALAELVWIEPEDEEDGPSSSVVDEFHRAIREADREG